RRRRLNGRRDGGSGNNRFAFVIRILPVAESKRREHGGDECVMENAVFHASRFSRRLRAPEMIGRPCAKVINSNESVRSLRNESRRSFGFEQYFSGSIARPCGSMLMSASPT